MLTRLAVKEGLALTVLLIREAGLPGLGCNDQAVSKFRNDPPAAFDAGHRLVDRCEPAPVVRFRFRYFRRFFDLLNRHASLPFSIIANRQRDTNASVSDLSRTY